MAHYKTILAYDGTEFNGFQRQPNGNTVQDAVESALTTIGWRGRSILAAGRTDTGVHASGQVISFALDWNHSVEKLRNALNANLPRSVAVQAVEEVDEAFHPRYDAKIRHYEYRLYIAPVRTPLKERYTWRVWPMPNMDLLNLCAGQLIGEHDFAAFGTPPKPGGPTMRQVITAIWQVEEENRVLRFDYAANAFLYHMVRRTVHLIVDIAMNKRDPAQVGQYFTIKQPIQGLAPATGLVLAHVTY